MCGFILTSTKTPMSVFTAVTPESLQPWLKNYAVGRLVSLQGIAAGVQNSNFFVTTTLGRYVLTLFEQISRAELPYFLHLMAHLSRHGLPVPQPIANRDNEYLSTLCDRPAVLVSCLTGTSVDTPTAEHCRKMGAMLAGLHLAGLSYGRRQENPRGATWRARTAQTIEPHLSPENQTLLKSEVLYQAQHNWSRLPYGVIHADAFRDNVLWNGEWIGGVIDFYFAGQDALLFDVAVTLNDWCSTQTGALDAERAEAFLRAYGAERPFTAEEHQLWPALVRAAALRFWLSRAQDFYRPRSGEMVQIKDPEYFRSVLIQRRESPYPLP